MSCGWSCQQVSQLAAKVTMKNTYEDIASGEDINDQSHSQNGVTECAKKMTSEGINAGDSRRIGMP
jgi:hypothetical protein